jgi:hypothetical protein
MLCRMTETEAKWAGRVAEWRQSGEGAEEFAEGRGFEGSTLRFWSSRLKTKSGEATKAKPSVRLARVVRRVSPATPGRDDAGIVVEVGLARITVRRGFDPAVLRDVVASLQGER